MDIIYFLTSGMPENMVTETNAASTYEKVGICNQYHQDEKVNVCNQYHQNEKVNVCKS